MAMKRMNVVGRRKSATAGKKRPRFIGNRKCLFAISAITMAQIYLQCTILHHNVQYSNSLIQNYQLPKVSSMFFTKRRQRSLSIVSTTSISKESDVPIDLVPKNPKQPKAKRSFEASIKINYKPSKDFRTPDDQEHIQLDWMVRNTAKVLGDDAVAPGEMTPQLIKITHSLMQVWARRAAVIKSSDAPHVVEKLLHRLLLEKRTIEDNLEDNEQNTIQIHVDDYNAVLEAWSHSSDPISADRAEQILNKMQEENDPGPNVRSYNAVIKALVKNGDRQVAVDKVEALVLKMDATKDIDIMPNRRSYNLLLYALANSNRDDAAEKVTKYLEAMISRYRSFTEEEQELCPVSPDINSFNQVIGTWARGKQSNYLEQMEKVYQLLLEWNDELQIQPTVNTYNALMGGWLKSNDERALTKIQEYFTAMEDDYKNGNKLAQPDRVSANTLQTALNRFSQGSTDANHLNLEDEYDIPKNALSQNILIEGIIKSGVGDAPEQVNQILNEMEEAFINGQENMKPDECSYSAVIKAYVMYKRKNTERKAEELLRRMWNLHQNHDGPRPNIRVYNSIMNAYASLKSKRTREKARVLLAKMEKGEPEGLPKPNLITYNTVIKAMKYGSKEEGAVLSEHILSRLECLGKDNPKLLPDNYSYTSVIAAYGRSSSPRKAVKALKIIQRMTEAQANGNKAAIVTTHTFNAALNACAFVSGTAEEKAQAFEIAQTLDRLREEAGAFPDGTWYGTMLRACSTLLPPSETREKLVTTYFQDACQKGSVGKLVLKQLKFAASREQQLRLLNRSADKGDYVDLSELPKEWTRNHGEDQRERPHYKQ